MILRYLFVLALIISACGACAGELSDSIYFGDAGSRKAHGVAGDGYNVTLSGRVGTVDEKIPCWTSGGNKSSSLSLELNKQPGKSFSVQIQEVYPPEAPGTRYTYSVYAGGKLIYVRDNPALMFGKTSYFVTVDDPSLIKAKRIKLRFVNAGKGSAFRICAAWLYLDMQAYIREQRFSVPMYLAPMMNGMREDTEVESEFKYLKDNIDPSQNDVRLGCAAEFYYMHGDDASSRARFDQLLKFATKYDMPIELAFVSWWSGTPMWIPDGLGGKFSDVKYQQVCWSETDNYDDGPELKKLLGDKYDLKYGLTVPNRWSSTPWLTMNSKQLNEARAKTIGQRLGVLANLVKDPGSKGYGKHILAIGMENEPRYWDLHCPDEKYPVKRKNLMGDFNPCTVADAAKDGIKLDPSDGLNYKERLWLHENVARYQQETYNAHANALRRLRLPSVNVDTDSLWHEVYSHGFPQSVYPMEQVTSYHPGLEWNRLRGCRAGLEDIARPAAAYLGVTREWGRWSQVNYEENNGVGREWHIRALRSAYIYGTRFYTFYNWQSINREGNWLRYVQTFCADRPANVIMDNQADVLASYTQSARQEFAVDTPFEWPVMNEIDLMLDKPGDYVLAVYDSEKKDRMLGYRRKAVSRRGLGVFDLPNSISIDDCKQVYVSVTRADGKPFGMLVNPDGKPVMMIQCDSRRERDQSLMICWRADAEALIDDLKRQGVKSTASAEKLFKAGNYRKAYETAAKLEGKTIGK